MPVAEVERIATWIPVTQEALDDAPAMGAGIEYMLLAEKPPLTPTERLTGLREWTSSEGVTITVKVGWRGALADRSRSSACGRCGSTRRGPPSNGAWWMHSKHELLVMVGAPPRRLAPVAVRSA